MKNKVPLIFYTKKTLVKRVYIRHSNVTGVDVYTPITLFHYYVLYKHRQTMG